VIRVDPFLRELIIQGSHIPLDYEVGGRSERIMELILDEIQAAPVLALHVPMPRHQGLTALCASLLDQPSMPALQKDWAARLHMNERTFARLFKREVGMTFGTWLRQARLLLSLTSLAQGKSILRVALDHGYESPSAFAAAFRRTFGLPPSAYLDKQRSHPDREQDR
jgi:AraC-like DNA-binding protein